MTKRTLLPSLLAAAALSTGCAHRQLAFPVSRAEAEAPPAREGVSAWADRRDDAVELAAGWRLGGVADSVTTRVAAGHGSTFGAIASHLSMAAPLARLYGFEEARSSDGVLTLAKELGPKVLSVHTAGEMVAVHWADVP